MQEHALMDKDASIFYRVTGEGEPVMLIHGFGEDGTIWNNLATSLAKEYRLIIPDIPGSGQSTGHIENADMETFAVNILSILNKESIDRCAMIGHSMGGYITLAFAEKYPERLTKLGLFHSTAYADSEEKKETRKKNIEFIRKHGSEKFIAQSVPSLFSEEFKSAHPEVIKRIIDQYSGFSPTSLVAYTSAMMRRPDRAHVLESIKKPVLFILGEYDTAVPLEHGLKQSSIPEFSYIYIGAHSGHMGMLEEPDFCLKALQDFLSGR